MPSSLKLNIKPVWEEIDVVRDQVHKFLTENKFDINKIHAIVMTASELCENAVKYGADSIKKDIISITIDIEKNEIITEVKNKIKDIEDSDLKRLDETIQWIRGYQNPFEAYIEKLKHISTKELEKGESGLGLVRIAYEGQSILDFYVNENDILAMSAVFKLKKE
ncbi:MAG: ATP-binding protein [Spirochaetia bacterium]|nr:ATP-binding protein [Spirochaetia bacterium]